MNQSLTLHGLRESLSVLAKGFIRCLPMRAGGVSSAEFAGNSVGTKEIGNRKQERS